MTSRTRTFAALVAFGLFASFVGVARAADTATGTWSWTMTRGDTEIKQTLKLKQEGEKLSGSLTSPGRDGAEVKTEISDGKVTADGVSFKVVREFNGNKREQTYTGKVNGDKLNLKVESERNGEKQTRDIEAKREGEKA
jgi:hypothetical protein